MTERDGTSPTLRERKRRRTRQALVDAATELFGRDGYDRTTVAAIAARAEIGTRTFFSYFPSKEDVLFPDAADRVRQAIDAIATRTAGEPPAEVLLRALRETVGMDAEMVSGLTALRMRLIRTTPAVRGRALHLQLDAAREIARHLHAAYPDDLDEVQAGALVGAFIGAVVGAVQVLLDDPDTTSEGRADLADRMRHATEEALRPWRS